MSADPTVEDFFLATAQALGLDSRLRREGMEQIARAAERINNQEPGDLESADG